LFDKEFIKQPIKTSRKTNVELFNNSFLVDELNRASDRKGRISVAKLIVSNNFLAIA